MRAALLCNGPSRVDYPGNEGYDYVIGCNIPWTVVDATVVIDEKVVALWAKDHDLIKPKAYFSTNAWRYTDEIKQRNFFQSKFLGIFESLKERDSSGHAAARLLIKKGYTDIDVWGADSWFEQTIVSSTHKIIPNLNDDHDRKFVDQWRANWKSLMEKPNVNINFKRNYV
jgi:hypothetical protein